MSKSKGVRYRKLIKLNRDYQDTHTRESYNTLVNYINEIVSEVNKNLQELEDEGYDYGAYDYAITFANTQFNSNRFPNARRINIDDAMFEAEIGIAFLNKPSSTVEQQKLTEKKRLNSIRGIKVIVGTDDNGQPIYKNPFKGKRTKTLTDFLKWLGRNEGATKFVNDYGNSNLSLETVFDMYQKNINNLENLESMFEEFNAGKIDLPQLLDKAGIKYSSLGVYGNGKSFRQYRNI